MKEQDNHVYLSFKVVSIVPIKCQGSIGSLNG